MIIMIPTVYHFNTHDINLSHHRTFSFEHGPKETTVVA